MGSSDRSGLLASTAHALSRFGLKNTSSVLAAVSGGVDSMCLVFILNELRKQGHLKKLHIIHINHSLRGKESDKDQALVEQFSKKLKIPVYTFSVDTRAHAIAERTGIEEAGRNQRYERIAALAISKKIDFIATAHNANDQAETVLMNIVRGAGVNGMRGIPETRKLSDHTLLIRPLLRISKENIREFAEKNMVPFREDKSNESHDFQRNRVRHQVLPALEKAFRGRDIYSGFSRMTQNIASTAEYIMDEVEELRNKAIVEMPSFFLQRKITSFDKKKLLEAPDFIRRELLLQEASSLSGRLISIDHIHSMLLDSYIQYPSKKGFPLSTEILLSHDKSYLTIESIDFPPKEEHPLLFGKKVMSPIGLVSAKKVKGWKKPEDSNTAYFNYDDLTGRKLMIRYWKPGDKMRPFGMKGKTRLVSDILGEAGIKTERLKYFVPLIVFQDEPDFILWIPGIR
ncbi:MAG: tRNA lysidine(34) synthetase TilS, partial [Candidatus Kapaibacterium sp.]